MLSFLETLVFLFGTAFIVGFITYGLRDQLKAPEPETEPVPPPPQKPEAEPVAEGVSPPSG